MARILKVSNSCIFSLGYNSFFLKMYGCGGGMNILAFPLTNVHEENCSLLPIPDEGVATYWSYWQRGKKKIVNHSKVAHQGDPWGISQEHIAGGEGTRILISCFYLADFFKGRYSKGSVSVWLILWGTIQTELCPFNNYET